MSSSTPHYSDLRINISISDQILNDIELASRAEGLNMGELFRLAGVNISNWHRWKTHEASPQLRNIEKLWSAILSKKIQNLHRSVGRSKLIDLLAVESPS